MLVSQAAIGSGFSEIVVIGKIAYICTDNTIGGGNWLRLYDVSNPAAPLPQGAVSLGTATFRCMTTDGSHVFVGVGDNPASSRLLIYDVSNPAVAPTGKGSLSVRDIPSRVALAGDKLYLTFWSHPTPSGALILDTMDVSNVAAPALLDYTSLGSGDGVEISVLGDLLLIPGLNFDVYARPSDQTTGSLRVAGGLMVDSAGVSNGGLINGVTFGIISGEGISSRRKVPATTASGSTSIPRSPTEWPSPTGAGSESVWLTRADAARQRRSRGSRRLPEPLGRTAQVFYVGMLTDALFAVDGKVIVACRLKTASLGSMPFNF